MGRRKPKPSDTPAAATPPDVAPLPASLVRRQVVFTCAHRHAGVDYKPGDRLMVTAAEAGLLRTFGVLEVD